MRLLTDRTGTFSGPSRRGEMGSFVVRSLSPRDEPSVQGADGPRGAIGRSVETVIGVLWQVLNSRWALIVPGALVALWAIFVVAVPGLRPGFAGLSRTSAGQVGYAWDLLHPAARLAQRGLFFLLMMVLLTRLAQGLCPPIDGLPSGEPSSLLVSATSTDVNLADVWERIFRAWGNGNPSWQRVRATPVTGQALVYPAPWRRICSQLPLAGAILALTGALVLWIGARGVTSAPLLGGDAADLQGLISITGGRLKAEQVFVQEHDGSVAAWLSWSLPAEEGSSRLVLGEKRWRPYRGVWLRVTDTPAALSLTVTDATGEPLPLVPVVGDRQSLVMYRGVVPEEEQVLTVPEAGIVVRVARTQSASGSQDLVVEAFDGGLGTLLGSAVPAPDAILELPGATIVARREPAAVVSIWRLPGLEMLVAGMLIGLAGMLLRRQCPPWRAWIGINSIADCGGWQVLMATEPLHLATRLCERLASELSAVARCDQA